MIENGQQLIEAIGAWLDRYVVLSAQQRLVMALWAVHTWVYDRLSDTTPYVEITGVSGSGKTRLLDCLVLLCRGAEKLQTIRTMYICRRIGETMGMCSILIDEAERLSSDTYGDQRSMLAGGYRSGGVHGVTVGKGTIRFPVWCPKAFTSLRTMTPVLHNRSIPIWMELGDPAHSLSIERERAKATAGELVASIAHVMGGVQTVTYTYDKDADAVVPRVEGSQPKRKIITVEADWLTERDREIWTPLVTLAHTLQLNAETIRALEMASVDLSSLRGVERRCDTKVEDAAGRIRSVAVRLLHDVRSVIKPGEVVLPTAELLARLHAIPTAPWRVYERAGLTDRQLADLMGAHGIEAKVHRVGKGRKDSKTLRGYAVKDVLAVKL